jgi:phosphoglycerate kinase
VADYLPSYAGRLMEAELNALAAALETPQKPVAAIVGGAKISTKLDLLNSLIEKMDMIILGGGMANTFLYAKGYDLKSSLCEKDMKETAESIMARAKTSGCDIVLPVDVTCATEFKAKAESHLYSVDAIGEHMMALDIGPKSFELIKDKLASCKTVLWNGPLGAFEIEPFDTYTSALAQYVQKRTLEDGMVSVAGGGDTVAALSHAGIGDEDFTYLSTAGGAFLEWLEGKTLPGVQALINAKKPKE